MSFRRPNSSRFLAGAIGNRMRSVSAAVSTARPERGFISPSCRTMGGDPTDMCRSEAFMSKRVVKSSSISPVGPEGGRRRGAGSAGAAATAGSEAAVVEPRAASPRRTTAVIPPGLLFSADGGASHPRHLDAPLGLSRRERLARRLGGDTVDELRHVVARLRGPLHLALSRRREDHDATARNEADFLPSGPRGLLNESFQGQRVQPSGFS